MTNAILISIGAGLACALVLIAGSVNPLGILFLLLFLPLPLLIAGLGFGYMYAALASGIGIVVTSAFTSPKLAVSLALVAIPSIILAYYALLSRDGADEQSREWYPAGRLLALITFISGVFVIVSLQLEGGVAAYGEKLGPVIDKLFEPDGPFGQQELPPEAKDVFKKRLIASVPYLLGAYTMMFFAINLYVSARLTRASGWLSRPWPDLHALKLPAAASLGLIISLGFALYGPVEYQPYAAGFAGAFFCAYTLIGLAIIHTLTHRLQLRGFALSTVYAGLLFLGQFIAPLLIILALADNTFQLRERFGPAPPGGPPSSPPHST